MLRNLFSTILKLGSTANPKLSACGGSNSWICGRYASLRIVSEKILTRAQSFPSHFLANYSFKTATRVFYWNRATARGILTPFLRKRPSGT